MKTRYFAIGLVVTLVVVAFAGWNTSSTQANHSFQAKDVRVCLDGAQLTGYSTQAGSVGLPMQAQIFTTSVALVASGTSHTFSAVGEEYGFSVAFLDGTFTAGQQVYASISDIPGTLNGAQGWYGMATVEDCRLGPGCDALVNVPAQAVNGRFVDNAAVYWAPQSDASTNTVVEVGKSYLVAGVDGSGMYAKVLISCEWVWVDASAVGPDYDAPWNGAPLPTAVVE